MVQPNTHARMGFEANFPTKLEKKKNATLINALIGSIFWNKNISCHDTFKKSLRLAQQSLLRSQNVVYKNLKT